MTESFVLTTADGVSLEAELAHARDGAPRAGMVLCHPHPQYGGTMRSIVIGALFDALPAAGVTCLRFNFRGVEGSEGDYTEGDAERLDARIAVETLERRLGTDVPLVLCGWSFGSDVALSLRIDAIDAWLGIACPLRWGHELDETGADPRPKMLALAQHDEFRPPAAVERAVSGWTNTTIEVVGGASHFFVGRTDRLVAIARDYVDRLTL
jgi:alpha/beta superfamily hydrolase